VADRGYVYVLLEPLSPSMVKIGRTRRSTARRVGELHGTGRAMPLVALWDEYVSEAALVEQALHERFADSRVSRRREFFYVAPKVAIAALIETAMPYRLEPFRAEGRVAVLGALRRTFGHIIRDDLQSVELLVTRESVLLVTTHGSAARDTTVVRSNLDFIYDDEDPLFNPSMSAEENAAKLLALDELTLIMTTNLVSEEEAVRIGREQNPYWTELWRSLDDPLGRDAPPPPF